jgi:hypothetical protein
MTKMEMAQLSDTLTQMPKEQLKELTARAIKMIELNGQVATHQMILANMMLIVYQNQITELEAI